PPANYTLSLHDALPISDVIGHLRAAFPGSHDRLDRSLAHVLHRGHAEADRLGHVGAIGLDGEEGLRALHVRRPNLDPQPAALGEDRKSTRLNSSHVSIS